MPKILPFVDTNLPDGTIQRISTTIFTAVEYAQAVKIIQQKAAASTEAANVANAQISTMQPVLTQAKAINPAQVQPTQQIMP